MGTPMKPNSREIQERKYYSKLSETKERLLQKTKKVGGLVFICIRYLSFNLLPFSEGILCTFENSWIHLFNRPVEILVFHFS